MAYSKLTPRELKKHNFFWDAKNRICTWYVGLTVGIIGLSIPIFSELVFYQVDLRVREDLAEEVDFFEEFLDKTNTTQTLTSKEAVKDFFKDFLSYRIPEDDTFLIAFFDENDYYSSPRALPNVIQNSGLMSRWSRLIRQEKGEQMTSDSGFGTLLYYAEPVIIEGKVQGVFVAVHATKGERQEALDVILIVVEVLLIGLVLAVILAWKATEKELAPLKSLAKTARSINDSDLTQRIPVQGSGEIAQLAMTFNRMMDRLQKGFESQRAFLDDVGHELRTPITIIQGHLELIDDDPIEQQATFELVLDELDRMNRFVNDLLLLAKSEYPDFLKLETVDISTLTEELHAKAKGLATRQWQLEGTAFAQIQADRQRLTQAIMNLCENATHYTRETDIIAIGSEIQENCVRLWVKDTGIGIEEAEQEKIFQRFVRGNQRSSREKQGHGLGLSIVQAIAQAHGGKVELISKVGVGSIFTLILPIK